MDKYILNKNSRLLTLDDVEGKSRLKLFDKIGLESKYTDFAYALGGDLVRDINSKTGYVSKYQLKSDESGLRQMVVGDHIQHLDTKYFFGEGTRLVTNIPFNKEGDIQLDDNNVPYVYYGEYPQTVSNKVDKYIIKSTKFETGDKYAIYYANENVPSSSNKSILKFAPEYSLNGNKYVMLYLENIKGSILLSNGNEVQNDEEAVFNVEPIKWYLDEETGILVSEKILSANVPFYYMNNHKDNVKRLTRKK